MKKNITIYKGNIYKVLAENITLVDNQIHKEMKNEIVEKDSLFYRTFGGFVNLDRNIILAEKEEAELYLESVINSKEEKIVKVLTSKNFSEEDRINYLKHIKRMSSCIYHNPDEVQPAYDLPKKEFKKLKETKKRGN